MLLLKSNFSFIISLQYLDKIGQNFFGVPPPQQTSSGGLFGWSIMHNTCS